MPGYKQGNCPRSAFMPGVTPDCATAHKCVTTQLLGTNRTRKKLQVSPDPSGSHDFIPNGPGFAFPVSGLRAGFLAHAPAVGTLSRRPGGASCLAVRAPRATIAGPPYISPGIGRLAG